MKTIDPIQSQFQHSTRFGDFGGCYAPETLMATLFELEHAWIASQSDASFQARLAQLLRDFGGRETPLFFAERLSKQLGLALYLKREDLLHTGAHKLNNALGQALLAQAMGKTRILAETGAGQHGVATATACALLGLECTVYMGARDAKRQAPNVDRMQLLGAKIELVHSGSATLKDAVNEALRQWTADPSSHYLLGSALGPHPFPSIVAGYQEVIGKEARAQCLAQLARLPDLAVACVGGGSNSIGLFRAFVDDESTDLVGVEAGGKGPESGQHAARFAGGRPGILHGCRSHLLQDESGQVLETSSISAGLDYPAVGPEHSNLFAIGRASYGRASDVEALDAFQRLSATQGILPALESSHALAWVIGNAKRLQGQSVLLCLSGRGDKDLDTVLRHGSREDTRCL
jgi:tryptophan synthase beta chain